MTDGRTDERERAQLDGNMDSCRAATCIALLQTRSKLADWEKPWQCLNYLELSLLSMLLLVAVVVVVATTVANVWPGAI